MNRKLLLYTCPVFFLPLLFAEAAPTPTNPPPVPYKSITPQVQTTLDNTALVVLDHISKARSDINRGAVVGARDELAEALRLMDTIRDQLSTAPAMHSISIARNHLDFEEPRHVLHDLPPIYQQLEAISTYLPTDKAKMHIDRCRSFLERNDRKGAERELASAGRSLIIIEVELPLFKAQQYVAKARGYLDQREPAKADLELKDAEQAASVIRTFAHSALFLAKENALLALTAPKGTNVGPYLENARNYLAQAASSATERGHEEAAQLSREIGALEKRSAEGGEIAAAELRGVWEKAKALAERSAAYLSAGVSGGEEATRNVEVSLIEAKVHVAYAEFYQMTSMEPEKALAELASADANLKYAATSPSAGPKTRKEISAIAETLRELRRSPGERSAVEQEEYDTIKDRLNDLIEEM